MKVNKVNFPTFLFAKAGHIIIFALNAATHINTKYAIMRIVDFYLGSTKKRFRKVEMQYYHLKENFNPLCFEI